MYLVHIYAYPYKYTYIQVLMAQNSCISQPYPKLVKPSQQSKLGTFYSPDTDLCSTTWAIATLVMCCKSARDSQCAWSPRDSLAGLLRCWLTEKAWSSVRFWKRSWGGTLGTPLSQGMKYKDCGTDSIRWTSMAEGSSTTRWPIRLSSVLVNIHAWWV